MLYEFKMQILNLHFQYYLHILSSVTISPSEKLYYIIHKMYESH